jgi:hypothetical protein
MSNARVMNFLSDSKEQLVCEVVIKSIYGKPCAENGGFDYQWKVVIADLMEVINSHESLTEALKRMRQGSIVSEDGNFSACQLELGEIFCHTSNYSKIEYTVTVREAYLNKVNPFLMVANKPGTYKENQLASGPPTAKDQPSV